jgi:protein HIRA/HIR1
MIQAPFDACTGTSHFRRLSWSPDGSLICATHAHKSKQDVGALIARKTWKNDVNFVGHRGVITTARFNPRLLAKTQLHRKHANETTTFACCALGGDDCTVSIWLADDARPLAVVKDCFDASVTDLSWSWDGYSLLSTSLDGSLCFFQVCTIFYFMIDRSISILFYLSIYLSIYLYMYLYIYIYKYVRTYMTQHLCAML